MIYLNSMGLPKFVFYSFHREADKKSSAKKLNIPTY